MQLKDIKAKEEHIRAERPKELRRVPKEMVRRSLAAVKEKGTEQLIQTAQNGLNNTAEPSAEEEAENQMLAGAKETGRKAVEGGNRMFKCAAVGGRAHRLEERNGKSGGATQGVQAARGQARPAQAPGDVQQRQIAAQIPGPVKEKRVAAVRQGEKSTRSLKAGKPAVKTAEQAVRQAARARQAKGARRAKQTAQRARQAAQTAAKAGKAAGKALVNTAKACIAAAKSLAAALAAGGGIALLIVLLICLIALVAGSAFGIFFSVEPTGKGMTLKEAVQTLNTEYYEQIKKIEADNPHDRVEYVSAAGSVAIRWEDVLSVFAADMAADEHGQQVVALDDGQLEHLRAVLADMHQISHSTRTEEHEETVVTTDEDGNEITEQIAITETVLVIEITQKVAAEMAAVYAFTPRQNEQLALLADPQYNALWMELLGGYVSGGGEVITPDTDWVGTGIFAWPLPQSFTITSNFGYRQDPFTGELTYHNGTDIAAPQGTLILAAAGGTVTIANGTDPWGGSYGYHIKIDHGGGMETLYAHCSAIAVTAGQQVRQGEVIGYVGSTGNSTGNHLHFEVWVNGQRTDAMVYYAQ